MNMAQTDRGGRRHLLAMVILAATAAAAQSAAAPATMVVGKAVANMYSAASSDADVVSQAIYAATVTVLEQKAGWSKVRTADDYTGWMETANLLRPEGGAYPAAKAEVLVVQSLFANIYREPDVTLHQPLITAPFETRLETSGPLTDQDGDRWYKVRLPDGRAGVIQKGDVSAPGPPLSIEEAQMLMRQRGITIPRDADVQAAWSGFVSVARDQLRPGDLLYFGASADKITHTGMYIGDGQFIHATTHDRPVVQISRLDEPVWTRLLVAARRVKP
jgi:SH3-like domain-containing protein